MTERIFAPGSFGIARNTAADSRKKRRPEVTDQVALQPTYPDDLPEARTLKREEQETLAECLAELDDADRELVRARFGGVKYDELLPDGARPSGALSARQPVDEPDSTMRSAEIGMKLLLMTIPDDPAALAGWLERQLIGLDLAAVIAELTAIHGERGADTETLADVLGEFADAVRTKGLNELPRARLQRLLRQPQLLLDLQEMVLIEGGRYWEQLPRDPELGRIATLGWQKLSAALPQPSRPKTAWYRHPILVAFATAAAVLIGVFVYQMSLPTPVQNFPVATAWGWNDPAMRSEAGPPAEYLRRLAKIDEAWHAERPESRMALAKRIGEMRQGCSKLILAEHRPLTPETRKWLVGKCRAWATDFDRYLVELERDGDVTKIRNDMDATVDKLAAALRKKADEVAG